MLLSSSIGLAIVKFLAVRGAKVYFTTRSEAKAQKVLESLLSSSPEIKRESLQWLRLDLTDLKSINTASDELKSRESKVDILSMYFSPTFNMRKIFVRY